MPSKFSLFIDTQNGFRIIAWCQEEKARAFLFKAAKNNSRQSPLFSPQVFSSVKQTNKQTDEIETRTNKRNTTFTLLSFFIEGFSSTEKTGRKVTLVTAHDGKRRRKGREREGAGEREFGVCVWREVLALQLASCHRNHPRTKKWEKWRDTERKRERGRDIEG